MIERYYQTEAAEKAASFLEKGKGNPLLCLPTGSGKTLVIVGIIKRYLKNHPRGKILVLSHVKEILEQNLEELERHFKKVGVYSAGLERKEVEKITVASIQSVYQKAYLFKSFKLVIVDEAHTINPQKNGMYRRFLDGLSHTVCVGLTATPFRLGHGYIHKGKEALFTHLAYDLSETTAFNRLVEEGYLCKLISKKTLMQMNTEGIAVKRGDFVEKELAERFDQVEITEKAVKEIIKFGKNYRKWLIFAIDINHAEHITEALKRHGIAATCIHSQMKGDRAEEIRRFKQGKYRALVNVNILTTGFNERGIDLIAVLRPTQSPVLHVQMLGRGMRPLEGKSHCLVLDFAGNIQRLGPINAISPKQKSDGKASGGEAVKVCPGCTVYQPIAARTCDVCGHLFEFKTKLTSTAGTAEAMIDKKPILEEWLEVDNVHYSIHKKAGSPEMLKVSYKCGLTVINQYILYEHRGYMGKLAHYWVRLRLKSDRMPVNTQQLYSIKDWLKVPKRIFVNFEGKFPEVLRYEWQQEGEFRKMA